MAGCSCGDRRQTTAIKKGKRELQLGRKIERTPVLSWSLERSFGGVELPSAILENQHLCLIRLGYPSKSLVRENVAMPVFSINPIDVVEIIRKWCVAVGLVVALALSGYAVFEVRTIESEFPQAFGDWERRAEGLEYQAQQDGFVLVYTDRGNVRTDRDFEIFVSDRQDNLRLQTGTPLLPPASRVRDSVSRRS